MKIRYIFFDCFNTLLDDFDHTGNETGMIPISAIPVKYGLYESADDFYQDYLNWRKKYWAKGNTDEVLLSHRLENLFSEKCDDQKKITLVVEEMIQYFFISYPLTIRKSGDLEFVLTTLREKVGMAVVSNFFLPGYPEQLLEYFSLRPYFDFVLDSAQIRIKKPGLEIYEQALALASVYQVDRSEILFIGDNWLNDVHRPRELGMQALFFDRTSDRPGAANRNEPMSFSNWTDGLRTILKLLDQTS